MISVMELDYSSNGKSSRFTVCPAGSFKIANKLSIGTFLILYRNFNSVPCGRLFESTTFNNHYDSNLLVSELGSYRGEGLWSPGATNFLLWNPEPKVFLYLEAGQKC